jgi:hypothetical protein
VVRTTEPSSPPTQQFHRGGGLSADFSDEIRLSRHRSGSRRRGLARIHHPDDPVLDSDCFLVNFSRPVPTYVRMSPAPPPQSSGINDFALRPTASPAPPYADPDAERLTAASACGECFLGGSWIAIAIGACPRGRSVWTSQRARQPPGIGTAPVFTLHS